MIAYLILRSMLFTHLMRGILAEFNNGLIVSGRWVAATTAMPQKLPPWKFDLASRALVALIAVWTAS